MSAIAQRRTAAAAAIMMLLAVLQYVLLSVDAAPAQAAGPEPTYGTAVVDGDIGEWDLGQDYFADMIKAGGQGNQTEVLGKAYLRYDCATGNLYVLALSEGAFDGLGEAWVKIYDISNSELNTTEAVVTDGGVAVGFETVVPNVAEGQYNNIEIHFNNSGDTASNVKGGGPLMIQCPTEPGEVTVSVAGVCVYDGEASYTYTVTADAGVTVDFDGGDQDLADGQTYVSASGSASWVATAPDGSVFEGTDSATASGTANVTDCTPPPTVVTTPAPVQSALGDLVWFDEDKNGQQDDPEVEFPINGATVTLLAPNGTVLAQQVTGVDGLYLFDELEAGNYRVEVCVEGAEYTTTNAPGVAKGVDSDAWPLADKAGCARTVLINLPEGVTDLTWDAGLVIEVRGIQVEPTTTTAPTTTTIEPVTVGSLPFTGFEVENLVVLGIAVLAVGSVILLLIGRREDDADSDVISGWSNN